VASCIRFDHRQAIHLLQHRLSMSHKDSIRLQRQKQNTPRASPLRVGFPRSGSHRLDTRRPGHRSKGPTGEASEPRPLKAPFQPLTQNKPLFNPHFPVRASKSIFPGLNPFRGKGHVKETLFLESPSRLVRFLLKAIHKVSLGLNPFRDKGHVKETLILEPLPGRETTKLQRRKGFTQGGERKLKPLSFTPLFLFERVAIAPQARPGLKVY
jgi:hypothetical protein